MGYHIADGIRSARGGGIAKVFTAIEKTGLLEVTVVVRTATDLTSLLGANLSCQTFLISSAA